MPTTCEFCGYATTYGELKSHHSKCESKPAKCIKCDFNGNKRDFIEHVINGHTTDLVSMFTQQERASDRECIEPRVNKAGNRAALGTTGKFYCGKRFNEVCICCNGNCGPTNGCNCVDCMELDVLSRALPPGYLVNSHGNISKLYGAKMHCATPNCKTGQIQCPSCRTLESQFQSRYGRITSGFK